MVLLSRGMGRRYLHLGIFNTVCSAIGFVAGLPWGPVGVATGYAVVTYVTAYPILVWAFRGTPLCFRDFLAGTSRPFVASIATAALCAFMAPVLSQYSPLLWIAGAALIFTVIYPILIRLLPGGKSDFVLISNLLRPLTSRR